MNISIWFFIKNSSRFLKNVSGCIQFGECFLAVKNFHPDNRFHLNKPGISYNSPTLIRCKNLSSETSFIIFYSNNYETSHIFKRDSNLSFLQKCLLCLPFPSSLLIFHLEDPYWDRYRKPFIIPWQSSNKMPWKSYTFFTPKVWLIQKHI